MRSDGRNHNDMRELNISYDGLNRADGSARFGFGHTKALASVSGPIEVRLAAEQASRATFEVTVRPLVGVPGTEAKALSSTIRAILTPSLLLSQNPRTLIQLVIQSVTPIPSPTPSSSSSSSSSPTSHKLPLSLVAALINSSTLALLNTGSVPMRGVVCAVPIGRLRSASTTGAASKTKSKATTLVLDPSDDELPFLEGGGCFAFLFAAGLGDTEEGKPGAGPSVPCEVVWSNWHATTSFDEDELVRARELARVGAERVWLKIKESVDWMGASFRPPLVKDFSP